MKIGILGGSFNPPHIGHLILAERVREKMGFEKIVFVPANIPPLKKRSELLDAGLRLHMVNLSIEDNKYFECSRVEVERGGISYTFQTLRFFKEFFGKKSRLFFIAGSDVLKNIHLWRKKEEIFELAEFVVAARKDFKAPPCLSKRIKRFEMEAVEISSSQIRDKIKKGMSIRYLVHDEVRNFILRKRLYLKK